MAFGVRAILGYLVIDDLITKYHSVLRKALKIIEPRTYITPQNKTARSQCYACLLHFLRSLRKLCMSVSVLYTPFSYHLLSVVELGAG